MNWLKKHLTKNNILAALASVVAVAGAPVALATAGIAVPAGLLALATKVVAFGTTAAVLAAKVLPGNGRNAPTKNPNGSAVDAEDPK